MAASSVEERLFDDFMVVGLGASLVQPNTSSPLAPKLLYHLRKGEADAVDAASIAEFCFPEVDDLNSIHECESFTFTLTQDDGTRVFGFCRRLAQRSQLPVCLCILSRRLWFALFMQMLQTIQDNYDLARFVPAFVQCAYDAPLPPAGSGKLISIEPLIRGKSYWGTFSMTPPHDDDRPTGVPYQGLLSELGVANMLLVLGALMTEQRVVFTGAKWGKVSGCAHAATSLLYPLQWQHIYIPVLPRSKLAYASAPMPFVLGVAKRDLAALQAEPGAEDIVFVDVDAGKLWGTNEVLEAAQLPSPHRERLHHDLSRLARSAPSTPGAIVPYVIDNAAVADAVLGLMARLLGTYRRFLRPKPDTAGGGNGDSGGSEQHCIHPAFDEERFVVEAAPSVQPFLRTMRGSQLFEVFVRTHVELSDDERQRSPFEIAVRQTPPEELSPEYVFAGAEPIDHATSRDMLAAARERAADRLRAGGDKLRAGVAALRDADKQKQAADKLRAGSDRLRASVAVAGAATRAGVAVAGAAALEKLRRAREPSHRLSTTRPGSTVDERPTAGLGSVDGVPARWPPSVPGTGPAQAPPAPGEGGGNDEDPWLAEMLRLSALEHATSMSAAAGAGTAAEQAAREEDELQLALAISASLAEAQAARSDESATLFDIDAGESPQANSHNPVPPPSLPPAAATAGDLELLFVNLDGGGDGGGLLGGRRTPIGAGGDGDLLGDGGSDLLGGGSNLPGSVGSMAADFPGVGTVDLLSADGPVNLLSGGNGHLLAGGGSGGRVGDDGAVSSSGANDGRHDDLFASLHPVANSTEDGMTNLESLLLPSAPLLPAAVAPAVGVFAPPSETPPAAALPAAQTSFSALQPATFLTGMATVPGPDSLMPPPAPAVAIPPPAVAPTSVESVMDPTKFSL